jgi:hypothetical protein
MSQQSHDAVHPVPSFTSDTVEQQPSELAVPFEGTAAGPYGAGAAGRGTDVAAARMPDPSSIIDASVEKAYWRDNYLRRPYADGTISFDHYGPAYRYGWESRSRFSGRRWDEVERELGNGWRHYRGSSRLGWSEAKQAARDAWQRVDRMLYDLRG